MVRTMLFFRQPFSWTSRRGFWMIALSAALLRIIILWITPLNLGQDEAQYWLWSREFAFGYFSKPPMIAWVIGISTAIFGNAEWAIRLASPIAHSITAIILYETGRRFWSHHIGLASGIVWLTVPAVFFSSIFISTDAILLVFWSLALYAFLALINNTPKPLRMSALLGGAIGFGLLSKYAMIYFLPGALAALWFSKSRLPLKGAAIAAMIAISLLIPNIVWNMQNGFETVTHTAANANWQGDLFHFDHLAVFLLGQFAMMGPLLLIITGLLIWKTLHAQPSLNRNLVTLLCLAATPMTIVTVQSFISRAHANWAATSYPALVLLVSALAMSTKMQHWVKRGVALNLLIGILLLGSVTLPPIMHSTALQKLTADLRDWPEQTATIVVAGDGYDAIITDYRDIISMLYYYGRDGSTPFLALNSNKKIDHHYEAAYPFDPAGHPNVLFVTESQDALGLPLLPHRKKLIGQSQALSADRTPRTLYLYAVHFTGQRD